MATQNPYSNSLLMDAFRGSLSNAESLGRGFAVAPVGLLGDVNALAREYITPRLPSSVQGLLQAAPAAPTTEQILSNIPRASAPRMETSGMEQLGAAMNPRGPVELARGAGRLAGEAVNEAMVYGRGPLASITPQPMRIVNEAANLIGQPAKSSSKLPTDYYELNSMATQAYADLRAKPSQEAADYYKSIMKARDEAANNPSKSYEPPTPDVVTQDYKGQHQAPTKDGGAPLWDMKGIYPDDFYSSQGARFYGDGVDEARDRMIVSQMQSMKGRPDKPVTIYRAVPKSVPTKDALNTGDWITLDRQYAKEHGEGALGGDYKIIKKTVKARDLFTNGDSIYEMGYDPQAYIPKSQRGLLD